MRYIAIGKEAAKLLVSSRTFQSTEYADGLALAGLLKGEQPSTQIVYDLGVSKNENGLILYNSESTLDNLLVIDLGEFKAFENNSHSDSLAIFQKICRISIKYWEKIPFSGREWSIAETDFIVLIPRSFSRGESARVVIDVKPEQTRQEKRNSQHLLAFYYGIKEKTVKPPTAIFKKAIEDSRKLEGPKKSQDGEVKAPLYVSTLDGNFKPIDSTTSFDAWKNLLTDKQSQFVFRVGHGPDRIEGAAGTGKTLSLSLRCCHVLNRAMENNSPLKAGFITHSQASKEYIENIILPKLKLDISGPNSGNRIELEISTLQDWCIQSLGNKIEETELLDKDAQSSKYYQNILIGEVLSDFKQLSLPTHEKFIGDDLKNFFSNNDPFAQTECIQYEIAEIIKGRSGQDLTKYKRTINTGHALPVKTDSDFECIFSIYRKYQDKLESAGYFDSDDVVLSALSQLESPIWRRRKNSEGFDILFVDESHLFNLNELSIVHHILKDSTSSNIIYSVDRSQSIGSLSLKTENLDDVFGNNDKTNTSLKTIFRSSPEIIRLAFSVLSSGSTIFTNLENPLDKVEESFTVTDDRRSVMPYVIGYESDESVIENCFSEADNLADKIQSKRSKILIVATTDHILSNLDHFASRYNKSAEFIKRRGDRNTQCKAERGGKYIISGIDYVGGLEFDGVLIVGADKGHLPATEENNIDSSHFLNHASYNRTYVAITRAKYGVAVLFSGARGLSKIFEFPVSENVISTKGVGSTR
jgi:superfamily I DNA/RNA helicase